MQAGDVGNLEFSPRFGSLWGATHARVAQLDRASGYEPEGREFESLRAHHAKSIDISSDGGLSVFHAPSVRLKDQSVRLSVRRLAWMQRIAALAIGLFWISFWVDHSQLPANVVDFEWCFLLPDILWISGAFWIASNWLIARDPRAGIATAVAGGSMVYLGLLDAACNFRHGQYTDSLSRGALNVLVNVTCLLFGCVNIWYAMKRTKFEDAEL